MSRDSFGRTGRAVNTATSLGGINPSVGRGCVSSLRDSTPRRGGRVSRRVRKHTAQIQLTLSGRTGQSADRQEPDTPRRVTRQVVDSRFGPDRRSTNRQAFRRIQAFWRKSDIQAFWAKTTPYWKFGENPVDTQILGRRQPIQRNFPKYLSPRIAYSQL